MAAPTIKLSSLIALAWGAQAVAFQPPTGCTATLTVQYKACLVSHIWTCPNDGPGEQWLGLFDQDGPVHLRKVDNNFQWLQSYYFNPRSDETMRMPAPDPASLDELLATGEDLYDFTVDIDSGGRSYSLRYQGFDRLTGESVVIDGETLLRTQFSYQALNSDGETLWSRAGRQYVSETHRVFFFGQDWDPSTPEQIENEDPVSFARPGEAGFLATKPTQGCDVLLSGLIQGDGA